MLLLTSGAWAEGGLAALEVQLNLAGRWKMGSSNVITAQL